MAEEGVLSTAQRAWAEGLGRTVAGMRPADGCELICREVLGNPAVATEEEAVWAAMVALGEALGK